MKTVRELHDTINDELLALASQIDVLAGREQCSADLRQRYRALGSGLMALSELLASDIPLTDESTSLVFSIEIRKLISEINEQLGKFDLPDSSIEALKELLNFPKYFLEATKRVTKFLEPLTKREKEVLLLLPRGLTAKAMATELFLTQATVKTHIAAIYRKFEVANRTQAIAIGVEAKLINF